MSDTEAEILACEEQLRLADASSEPDTSSILDRLMANDIVLVGPKGEVGPKSMVIEAHRPPRRVLFESVTMSEFAMKDFGDTVVVNCRGDYAVRDKSFAVRFTRVWHRNRSAAEGQWKVEMATVSMITP